MSLIRVPLSALAPGERVLDEEAARYVARVHRLRDGDAFLAFDPEQGTEAEARILSSRRGVVRCEVGAVVGASRLCASPAWLLLGVCKGDRFEWALREATALGATDIVPTLMRRSASSSGVRAGRDKQERWRRILVQGARQSGRGDLPRLHPTSNLTEALSGVPRALLRVCLWEKATEPAGQALQAARKHDGIALLVGPEGGMDEQEVDQVAEAGFRVVSMGPLILRTETAVVAALGAWSSFREAGF